jgi:hypothetical protein
LALDIQSPESPNSQAIALADVIHLADSFRTILPRCSRFSFPKFGANKPILSSSYKLSSELIAMVKDQSFSGKVNENPIPIYMSLKKFTHVFTLRACLMKLYDGSFSLFD